MSYSHEIDGASQGALNTLSRNHFHPIRQQSTRQGSRIDRFTPVNHRAIPSATTAGQLPIPGPDRHTDRRTQQSSATWTCSSGDPVSLSDTDDIQDRPEFIQEYNRLARKHGIRMLDLEATGPPYACEPPPTAANISCPQTHQQGEVSLHRGRRRWFSRSFFRQGSGTSNASSTKHDKKVRHKRSVSDMAMLIVNQTKRDSLKDEDLQSLVRLCGKSILYLPSEYAPGSLVLPTCLRATAQYLVQHATETRGIFRIPGSIRVVNALYDYYCAEGDADEIASTIRCPNLPSHIKAGTHDVASAFKRLLSGLPGGILGSLQLFDALVAIHSQLDGDAEFTKTKQTKLRARLIALAVSSARSHFRRELICAVFGLLCLIGRTAETTPREDEHGRPLPTSDLMGYNALGIVFGPLLVGDLINSYTMKLAMPKAGPMLHPVTPPHTGRERRKSKTLEESESRIPTVDKIHVANSIAEMLITHWREVAKHIRSLGVLRVNAGETGEVDEGPRNSGLRPSASESFVMRRPAEWSKPRPVSAPYDMNDSPVPPSPTPEARRVSSQGYVSDNSRASLVVQRLRPKGARSLSNSHTCPKTTLAVLSPTVEEPASVGPVARPRRDLSNFRGHSPASTTVRFSAPMVGPDRRVDAPVRRPIESASPGPSTTEAPSWIHDSPMNPQGEIALTSEVDIVLRNSMYSSSRHRVLGLSGTSDVIDNDPELLRIPNGTVDLGNSRPRNGSSAWTALVENVVASPKIIARKQQSERSFGSSASDSKDAGYRNPTPKLKRSMGSSRASQEENIPPGRCPATLPGPCADEFKQKEDGSPSPIAICRLLLRQQGPHPGGPGLRRTKPVMPRSRHIPRGSSSPTHPSSPSMSGRRSHLGSGPPTDCENTLTSDLKSIRGHGEKEEGVSRLRIFDARKQVVLEPNSDPAMRINSFYRAHAEGWEQTIPASVFHDEMLAREEETLRRQASRLAVNHDHHADEGDAESTDPAVQGGFSSPHLIPPPPSTPVSEGRPQSRKSIGSAVKAIAARFESASNESSHGPSSTHNLFKPSCVRSQYTVNPSPRRSSKPSPSKLSRLSRSDSVHSGRPPWIAALQGESPRLSVGEPHANIHELYPGQNEVRTIREHDMNTSTGGGWAAPLGNDGACDTHPIPNSRQNSSEEAVDLIRRGVRMTFQPVTKMESRQEEDTRSSAKHQHRIGERTPEVEQARFVDSAGMPRLPPQSSPRCPPHSLNEDVDLSASTIAAEHLVMAGICGSENEDVTAGHLITSLRQQLQDKTEEANQLRDLLDSKDDTDAVMLREQLRLVERECLLWRSRAERAEKRVATFTQLAARVKALKVGDGAHNTEPEPRPEAGMDQADNNDESVQEEGMRRVEQWLEQDRMEFSGERTEDGEADAARICQPLQPMEETALDVAESHYDREDEGSMSSRVATTREKRAPLQGLCRSRYRNGATDEEGEDGISPAVASMWVAAEGMFERMP